MKFYSIDEQRGIIELVKQIQSIIKMDSINIEYEFGKLFVVSSNYENSHHTIELYKGKIITKITQKINMDSSHFGLSEYFNELNIKDELQYHAWYIFCLLHEFGHVHQFQLFNSVFEMSIITNSTQLMIDGFIKNKLPTEIKYKNTYNELYAEKFAYRWFPIIWNKFKGEIIKTL